MMLLLIRLTMVMAMMATPAVMLNQLLQAALAPYLHALRHNDALGALHVRSGWAPAPGRIQAGGPAARAHTRAGGTDHAPIFALPRLNSSYVHVHRPSGARVCFARYERTVADYDGGGTAFYARGVEPADAIRGKAAPTDVLRPNAGTAMLWGGTLTHAAEALSLLCQPAQPCPPAQHQSVG